MSNFTFLKTGWPELFTATREAEQNLASTPLSKRLYVWCALEVAVKWLYCRGLLFSASALFARTHRSSP